MRDGDTRLIRAAGSMSAMTSLSRIAGWARDNLQAHPLGGVPQLPVQMPTPMRFEFRLRRPRPFYIDGVHQVARLTLPRILGAGTARVAELTLGILGVNLSTGILPSLSQTAAGGGRPRALETLARATRLFLLITLPPTLGRMLAGRPKVAL